MELKDAGTRDLGSYSLKQNSLLNFEMLAAGCDWRPGDRVRLVREPEDLSSPTRVSVHWRGQGPCEVRLGVLQDERLARHLDGAGRVEAHLRAQSGILSRWFARLIRRTVAVAVEVSWGESDWTRIAPVVERSNSIGIKIEQANHLKKRDPQQAAALFRDAISDIYDLHFEFPEARSWRRIAYPVIELASLLEQLGDVAGAYQVIRDYEGFSDQLGLVPRQRQVLRDLKFRLEKRQIFTSRSGRPDSVTQIESRRVSAARSSTRIKLIAR